MTPGDAPETPISPHFLVSPPVRVPPEAWHLGLPVSPEAAVLCLNVNFRQILQSGAQSTIEFTPILSSVRLLIISGCSRLYSRLTGTPLSQRTQHRPRGL